MRMILGLTGAALIAFAVGWYGADIKTALCLFLTVGGLGLVGDSVKK